MIGSFNLPQINIVHKKSYLEFPTIGDINSIYIDIENQVFYRWDKEKLKYYKDSQDYRDIKVIKGGDASGQY